jgi:hypothetical protein
VRERGMEIKVDHPFRHDLSLIRNPLTFSETPVKEYRAPPLLGENTREVLAAKLGYDDARMDALKQQGIRIAKKFRDNLHQGGEALSKYSPRAGFSSAFHPGFIGRRAASAHDRTGSKILG